jgi:hypothetical protein
MATALYIALTVLAPLRARAGDRGIQPGAPVDNAGNIIVNDDIADQLARTNARFVRLNLKNPWCTDTAAFYGAYDAIIGRLQARGLTVIALLSNELMCDPQSAWNEDATELGGVDSYNTYIDRFGYQAARVIAHYRARGVRHWEIWNEPNCWSSSTAPPSCGLACQCSYIYPSIFSRLLSHVYTQVKYYNVYDVEIISGGLLGHNIYQNDQASSGADYLRSTYAYGINRGDWSWIKQHTNSYPLDHIGHHLYLKSSPSTLANDVQLNLGWIRNAYTTYEGASTPKQIYITEIGWQSSIGEQQQADALTTSFNVTLGTSYVAVTTWFVLRDWSETWGLQRVDGSLKPAWFAFGGSAPAGGSEISLVNDRIESNGTNQFGPIGGWSPSGAWAYHSAFSKPGNAGLGERFGYYTSGGSETVGQVTTTRFVTNSRYDFSSWAQGGGDNAGRIPYELGYAQTDNDLSTFRLLARQVFDVTGNTAWSALSGVSHTTGGSGPEVGKQIIVRLGNVTGSPPGDIWFDSFKLTRTGAISLLNSGLESTTTPQYGYIDGWTGGGWAYHSSHPKPGNEGLESKFGFYATGSERVRQLTSTRFTANTTYTFRSFAHGGNDNAGRVPYQIGYASTDGAISSFMPLATRVVDVTGRTAWTETEGVTYTTGAAGAELGKQIIVRLGNASDGGSSDIWFDKLSLTYR